MSGGDPPSRRTVLETLGGAVVALAGAGTAGATLNGDPDCSPYQCPSQYPQYPYEAHDSDTATDTYWYYETDHDAVAIAHEPQAADYASSWEMWVTTSSFVATEATADHELDGYVDNVRKQKTVCHYEEVPGTSFEQERLDGWLGAREFTSGTDAVNWDDFAVDTIEFALGFVPYVGAATSAADYLGNVAAGVSEWSDDYEKITRRWTYDDGGSLPRPGTRWKSKASTYVKYRADMEAGTEMDVTIDNEPTTFSTTGETATSIDLVLEAPESPPQQLSTLSDRKLRERGVERVDRRTARRSPEQLRRLTPRNRRRVLEGGETVLVASTASL